MTQLTGSCVSLFHGVISCGLETFFVCLFSCLEGDCQVYFSGRIVINDPREHSGHCAEHPRVTDVEEKLLVWLGQVGSEGKRSAKTAEGNSQVLGARKILWEPRTGKADVGGWGRLTGLGLPAKVFRDKEFGPVLEGGISPPAVSLEMFSVLIWWWWLYAGMYRSRIHGVVLRCVRFPILLTRHL